MGQVLGHRAVTDSGVSLVGPHLAGQCKYEGGVKTPDGSIYCIPGHAKTVLRISSTGEITTLGGPLHGKFKYLRGVLAKNGSIYCVPCWAEYVLKIVPSTGEVGTIGISCGPQQWKWHGG